MLVSVKEPGKARTNEAHKSKARVSHKINRWHFRSLARRSVMSSCKTLLLFFVGTEHEPRLASVLQGKQFYIPFSMTPRIDFHAGVTENTPRLGRCRTRGVWPRNDFNCRRKSVEKTFVNHRVQDLAGRLQAWGNGTHHIRERSGNFLEKTGNLTDVKLWRFTNFFPSSLQTPCLANSGIARERAIARKIRQLRLCRCLKFGDFYS